MEGWFKYYRKSVDNPLYFSEPFTKWQAWTDMILIANHAEGFFFKRGIKIQVTRGQIGYDLDTLAKRWKWSRGKVERFFRVLEIDKQITRQKSNVSTLITVLNYDLYQGSDKANDKANGHQTVNQTDTNKNDNNENNNISVVFDAFRKEYPGTKRGLKTELALFLKKSDFKNNPGIVHLLLPALEREKLNKSELSKSNGFVPNWKNLKTWINNKCWEQEFETPTTNNPQPKTKTLNDQYQ